MHGQRLVKQGLGLAKNGLPCFAAKLLLMMQKTAIVHRLMALMVVYGDIISLAGYETAI